MPDFLPPLESGVSCGIGSNVAPFATILKDSTMSIVDNIRAHFRAASAQDHADGMIWYPNARLHAHAISLALRKPLECGAGIIASYSPLTGWAQNLAHAWSFVRTGNAPTFGAHNRMAAAVLVDGMDAVTGPKINPFGRAMMGDLSQVVNDSWMNFIATYAPGTEEAATARRIHKVTAKVPNLGVKRRREMDAAVRQIADESGLWPAEVQAITWVEGRGSAD